MQLKVFDVDFIKRSREIIEQYDKYVLPNVAAASQYEVTLLINCLLGLLILPKERKRHKIPDLPIAGLPDWGIRTDYITKPGKDCVGRPRTAEYLTVLELVTDLRHSVAHILFKPLGDGKDITHLEFHTDRSKVKLNVPVTDFRVFVKKLADCVLCEPEEVPQKVVDDAPMA